MTLEKEARIRKRLQRASWLRGKITVAKNAIKKGVASEDASKDDVKKEKWNKYTRLWIDLHKQYKDEYDNL